MNVRKKKRGGGEGGVDLSTSKEKTPHSMPIRKATNQLRWHVGSDRHEPKVSLHL